MTAICRNCGAVLPSDARRGICPLCLLKSALESGPEEEVIHLVLPDGKTEPLPFLEIGDYELIEQVGHGGMGLIFKARQKSLDRVVALKLIRHGSLAGPEDLVRFRTEAAAAARLEHPHIVAIHEIGEHEGRPYYTMEYVAGRSLANALNDGPFPPRRAAELVGQIAGAIHFAHERGVLHRDLKPSNILIDAEQEPRVADFGLAKIIHDDSELTLTGTIIGSPDYMPPEQARGRSAETSVRSDVYSLGAILYEMLTGRPPFAAATALETIKLVVEQDPAPPRALNPLLPRDLETICLKCLAKEQSDRYATALELAEELGRYLKDEPILARPAGRVERAWRWCRRNHTLAALSVVLFLTPLIIISLLIVKDQQIERQRNRALAQEHATAQNLYAADITLALQALKENDYGLAWRSLAAHLPSDLGAADANDLRGFEWRWLWAKAQGEALRTLTEHVREVSFVAWSPDGRLVASASHDGTARVWDAAKMSLLQTYEHPSRPPNQERAAADANLSGSTAYMASSVSFSCDSRFLLIGMRTGISARDLSSGRLVMSLNTNIQAMALCSPVDPNMAVTFPIYPRTSAGILDIKAGALTRYFTNERVDAVCILPNGKAFARADRRTRKIFLQAIPDGQTVASFDTGDIYVISMAVTPDGRTLAAANLNGPQIELFDLKTKQQCGELRSPTGRLLAVAISPDGKILASGGFDQTIRIWDLDNRRQIRELHGHRATVAALAFSPDSRRVVSDGFDSTVRFWDVNAPPPQTDIADVRGPFAFSADNRLLVTQGSNGLARLWELPAMRLLNEWRSPRFQSAVMLQNGWLLAARLGQSNDPPVLAVENPIAGTTLSQTSLAGISSDCVAVELSSNGKTAVTGYADGSVAAWDASSGRLLHTARTEFMLQNQPQPVDTLAISTDGSLLFAAASHSVTMKTWALRDFTALGEARLGDAYHLGCAVAPDGQRIASVGTGQGPVINIWDEHLRGPKARLQGRADSVDAVAFSPDGRTIVAAGRDGDTKLWHLGTGRELGTLMTLSQGVRYDHLAFSQDGSWLGIDDTSGGFHLFHAPVPVEH